MPIDITPYTNAILSSLYGEEVKLDVVYALNEMVGALNTAIGTQVLDRATVDELVEQAVETVAPLYSSSNSYSVGSYVSYENKLYKCKTNIPSGESWDSSLWDEVAISADVAALSSKVSSDSLILTREGTSIPANSDLNNYTTAGNYYVLNTTIAKSLVNSPSSSPGALKVLYSNTASHFYQIYIVSGVSSIYFRYATGHWYKINDYFMPNGTEDSSAKIVGLLNSGVCRLGPYDYYVSGVNMPNDSAIIGCGKDTRIILMDSVTSGAAIKMGSNCTVSNCSIIGSSTDITFTDNEDVETITIGTRHGIMWLGDATESNSSANKHFNGLISNCYISGFTGGGITCEMSGYGTTSGISADNCHILNCGAGINVSYWSEYSRFTGINCNGCYYGCINNGGNNSFVNCSFNANHIGFYVNGDDGKCVLHDGTTKDIKNGGHGNMIGCVINHTGMGESENNGYAIFYKSIDSGFVFDGLQVFYGKIYFRGGSYVMVSNANFGNSVDIIIYTSTIFYMFTNCYFRANRVVHPYDLSGNIITTFDSEGNTNKIKFINTYLVDGTRVSVENSVPSA